MYQLKLNVELKDYPWDDFNNGSDKTWSIISLDVCIKEKVVKNIIDIEWNSIHLFEWLIECEDSIKNEDVPLVFQAYEGKSIAQMRFLFYKNLDTDLEDEIFFNLLKEAYDYSYSHGLRFALRGVNILGIFIGKVGEKHYISCYEGNYRWNFEIDIDTFFKDVRQLNSLI